MAPVSVVKLLIDIECERLVSQDLLEQRTDFVQTSSGDFLKVLGARNRRFPLSLQFLSAIGQPFPDCVDARFDAHSRFQIPGDAKRADELLALELGEEGDQRTQISEISLLQGVDVERPVRISNHQRQPLALIKMSVANALAMRPLPS